VVIAKVQPLFIQYTALSLAGVVALLYGLGGGNFAKIGQKSHSKATKCSCFLDFFIAICFLA